MEDILIPIVAIFSVFGLPAVVVISIIVALYKARVARYRAIEQVLNSNASPEVIEKLVASISAEENKKPASSRQSSLIQGTILLALGAAFLAFHYYSGQSAPLYIGTLLLLLAAAKLIIAFFIIKEKPQPDGE